MWGPVHSTGLPMDVITKINETVNVLPKESEFNINR